MPDIPPEAYEDCFHPPSIPTEVFCLHCQRTYESYLMEWRECDDRAASPSQLRSFWCCPTPGCSGAGFGFDIHPLEHDYIDPDGRDMGQWVDDGCGSEDEVCACFECRWARGDVDPGNISEEDREAFQEHVRAQEEPDEAIFELCTCGGGEDHDDDDDDASAIPLDDLLPVNEAEGEDIDITWELMMEIEKKCGLGEGPGHVDQAPSAHCDLPPITEDDIPF